MSTFTPLAAIGLLAVIDVTAALGQTAPAPAPAPAVPQNSASVATNAAPLPPGYIIGPDDILQIVFWRDKDLSSEVVVRPDGRISLPLINDVMAAGRTPEELRADLVAGASKFLGNPNATVVVKEIRSRKVYIIGEVVKTGTLQLASEMTVLQAIGESGGFVEGADKGDVIIVRNEGGKERRFKFNYNDVVKGKNPEQNIRLMPGDTIIVH